MTVADRTLLEATRAQAEVHGLDLWLVGGAVRDLALARPVHDLDLATRGDAGALATAVATRLNASVPGAATVEHETRFGTTMLRFGAARLDLARLRCERYARPGALPEVTFVDAIEEDLGRRDFTVNAMALGVAGAQANVLVDPLGGLRDLDARRLRVLHPRSFIDDATRLWRGARTAAVFDLRPDAETARLIAGGTRWLDTISGERIMAEIAFTAQRGRSGRTLALAEEWGVLHGTHPALRLDASTGRALRHRPGAIPVEIFVALLLAPIAHREAILRRLAASRALGTAARDAARLLAAGRHVAGAGTPRRATPDEVAPLESTGTAARTAARWLDPAAQGALQRDLVRWGRTRPLLTPEALVRLGVPRGPALGRTLDMLRRARYLGTLETAAEARREVRRTIAARGGAAS